jgi:hypothetical protein
MAFTYSTTNILFAVLRTHDILVWIRIRIRGSECLWLMYPDPDSDPDPAIFVIDLQDANMKLIYWKSFFAYYFLKYLFKDLSSTNTVISRIGKFFVS